MGKKGRAAVAAADYEKVQQKQLWSSITLLHTYTYLECSKHKEELRKKREERERRISRRNQLLVPMPMPPTSSLLKSTMGLFFCLSFSFIRSAKR
jgi:hypothetical protein